LELHPCRDALAVHPSLDADLKANAPAAPWLNASSPFQEFFEILEIQVKIASCLQV
jgi:hypothetical protein